MEVTSRDFFALDGISCSDVGLWCDTPPIQVLAEERGKNYQVGADEDIYKSDDSYGDIQFRFTAYAFFADDFDQSNVYAFLHGKSKLTMSRNNGYYWKIRSISCNPSQSQDGKKIRYQITIRCAPFRYVDNEEKITLTSAGNVENLGTRFCKPVYVLHLNDITGTGTLDVNGQTVSINLPQYATLTKTLVIDSEKQLSYDGDNVIQTKHTSGIYPWMGVGENYVSFGGIIDSITIKRNERCY